MANPEKQRAMAEKFIKGKISIRDWREQMNTVMGMYVRPRHLSASQVLSLGFKLTLDLLLWWSTRTGEV